MKKTFLCALMATVATCASSQILKPGFEKQEYIECLAMASNMDSLQVDNKYLCPKPQSFAKKYVSKPTGFDNAWELWQDDRGVCAIMLRATVSTITSWGANFNAGMVRAIGTCHAGTDVRYDFCADSMACVHAGWTAGLMTMRDDILAKLDSCYKAGVRDFIVAGHSQGGALSILTTAMLRRMQVKGEIPADITIKTYASAAPKVGDYLFAMHYEAATQGGWSTTVLNADDWVPETPLSVQRPTDFRPTNPFAQMDSLLADAGGLTKMKVKFLFNRLDKPTSKSVENLTKYLGNIVGSLLEEGNVWFNKPDYTQCANYARCGTPYILMPDAEYHRAHPLKAQDAFEHHQYVAYYELAQKIK